MYSDIAGFCKSNINALLTCPLAPASPILPKLFMATIKPFAALRPRPGLAEKICELPYDVMSSEEAREIAAGNPLSFLRVSKPEIELPPGTDIYAPEVYTKGKENFQRLIADGALRPEAQPCFYLYRQVMGKHYQVGLVAVASCAEYVKGVVKRHELTRPDKEDDRVRHIETLNSQTGPVFLAYRAVPTLDALVTKTVAGKPDIDFSAADGVRHTSWTIRDTATTQRIEQEFGRIPSLYIADGHHRCAAAARVYLKRKETNPHPVPPLRDHPLPSGGGETNPHPASGHPLPIGWGEGWGEGPNAYFLAVIFPHNQMQILPYNRVLKDLNGIELEGLLQKLNAVFIIKAGGSGKPSRKHELGLYLAGKWHALNFRPRFAATTDPIEKLDVTLLQKFVLDPIFGIADPRTSKRINFVGGIRGTAELEKLVNSGEYACAFSLFPTSIEDLMTVADAGGIMPPKSTWFEPKLRDGMFCHLI